MSHNISLDIETFSLAPNASIATIAMVSDATLPGRGLIVDAPENMKSLLEEEGVSGYHIFYRIVKDPEGDFSPRTIRWHGEQENPTINIGRDGFGRPLAQVLHELDTWLDKFNASEAGAVKIWSHNDFDLPALKSAYYREEMKPFWHYRSGRDLRTLYDIAGERPELDESHPHNAVFDAIYQLREINWCLNNIYDES